MDDSVKNTCFNGVEESLKHFGVRLVLECDSDSGRLEFTLKRLHHGNGTHLVKVEGRDEDAVPLGSLKLVLVDVALFDAVHRRKLLIIDVEEVHWGLIHTEAVRLFLLLDFVMIATLCAR